MKALAQVTLGHHGLIRVGEDVPSTFLDSLGDECRTDFDRLRAIGVVASDPEPAPEAKRRGRPPKAQPTDTMPTSEPDDGDGDDAS